MWLNWWTGSDARDPNPHVCARCRAGGEKIPVWLLGSSLYSAACCTVGAALRVRLPLPALDMLHQALHLYLARTSNLLKGWRNRTRWCVSTSLPPTAIAMRNSCLPHAAGVCEAASRWRLASFPPPVENMHQLWSASEQYGVHQALSMSLVGDKAKVRHGLEAKQSETQADEIIVSGPDFPIIRRAFALV